MIEYKQIQYNNKSMYYILYKILLLNETKRTNVHNKMATQDDSSVQSCWCVA